MDPDEANLLYEQITEHLRTRVTAEDRKSNELLDEIEAEIEAGKAVQVRLKVPQEKTVADPVTGDRRSTAQASGEFTERQSFSPFERLEILIEGVALAAVGPVLMAERIDVSTRSNLDEEQDHGSKPTREIVFARDGRDEPERTVHPGEALEEAPATRHLLALLDEVRAALPNRLGSKKRAY